MPRNLRPDGISCGICRSGHVSDNAEMEIFFSTMKTERVSRKVYAVHEQAKADMLDYLERFYNPWPRYSTILICQLGGFSKRQQSKFRMVSGKTGRA